jgi:predicted Zn-dependent protease
MFPWARERMRVLTADSASAAIGEYDRQRRADPDGFSDAQRYGAALARSRASQTQAAQAELLDLAARRSTPAAALWLQLALAENEHRAGHRAAAFARYDTLLQNMPRSRAVALSYAHSLSEDGSVASARKAQDLLRPLLPESGNDPTFQRAFARASEVAGDLVRAGEAHAEAAYLSGRAEDALNQLGALKKRDDLDYYQRARIDARIASLTPLVLELRKQGLRAGDAGARLGFDDEDRARSEPAEDAPRRLRFSVGGGDR